MRMHVEHVISKKYNKIEMDAIIESGLDPMDCMGILDEFYRDLHASGCPLSIDNFFKLDMSLIKEGKLTTENLVSYFTFAHETGMLWKHVSDIPESVKKSKLLYKTALVSSEHLFREAMELNDQSTFNAIKTETRGYGSSYLPPEGFLNAQQALMVIKVINDCSMNEYAPNMQYHIVMQVIANKGLREQMDIFEEVKKVSGDPLSKMVLRSIGENWGSTLLTTSEDVRHIVTEYERFSMPLSKCKELSRRIMHIPKTTLETLISEGIFSFDYVKGAFKNWMLEAVADNLAYFCENNKWERPDNIESLVMDLISSGHEMRDILNSKFRKSGAVIRMVNSCELDNKTESAPFHL